jgi:hypothetical protein
LYGKNPNAPKFQIENNGAAFENFNVFLIKPVEVFDENANGSVTIFGKNTINPLDDVD